MNTNPLPSSVVEQLRADIRKSLAEAQASAEIAFLQAGSLAPLAHELAAPIADAFRQAHELLIKPFGELYEKWVIAQGKAANWLEQHREAIEQLAALGPAIERVFENTGKIGQLGWAVGKDMPFPVVLYLSECRESSQADAYMLKWYEENDPELNDIEQRLLSVQELEPFYIVLKQAFAAFRSRQFALTIPLLISILEQALRHLGDSQHPFSTDISRTVKDKYKNAKARDEDSAFYLWSLHEFTIEHYKHYRNKSDGDGRIRRKGVMHGLQVPPNQKVEAIRLFHVISTVTEHYGGELPFCK